MTKQAQADFTRGYMEKLAEMDLDPRIYDYLAAMVPGAGGGVMGALRGGGESPTRDVAKGVAGSAAGAVAGGIPGWLLGRAAGGALGGLAGGAGAVPGSVIGGKIGGGLGSLVGAAEGGRLATKKKKKDDKPDDKDKDKREEKDKDKEKEKEAEYTGGVYDQIMSRTFDRPTWGDIATSGLLSLGLPVAGTAAGIFAGVKGATPLAKALKNLMERREIRGRAGHIFRNLGSSPSYDLASVVVPAVAGSVGGSVLASSMWPDSMKRFSAVLENQKKAAYAKNKLGPQNTITGTPGLPASPVTTPQAQNVDGRQPTRTLQDINQEEPDEAEKSAARGDHITALLRMLGQAGRGSHQVKPTGGFAKTVSDLTNLAGDPITRVPAGTAKSLGGMKEMRDLLNYRSSFSDQLAGSAKELKQLAQASVPKHKESLIVQKSTPPNVSDIVENLKNRYRHTG